MKKYFFIILFLFGTVSIIAQEEETKDEITTYYLIRHAEKDRSNKKNRNPKLTEIGLKRANNWKEVFTNIDLDVVYSTNYHRTRQTATPTAESKNLEIQSYDARKMFTSKFQKSTKGQNVLIVGHSNTTPFFVNKILGENKYEQIADDNNSNLYIVTVTKERKTCVVLKID
jgi:broad specificity phosphatase PhoE